MLLVVARHLGLCLLDPEPTGPPESEHSFLSQSCVPLLRTIQSQLNRWSAVSVPRATMVCRTSSSTALRLPSGAWNGSDHSVGCFPLAASLPTAISSAPSACILGWPPAAVLPISSAAAILPTSHSGCPANFSCSLTINFSCGFTADFSCVGGFNMHHFFDQTQIVCYLRVTAAAAAGGVYLSSSCSTSLLRSANSVVARQPRAAEARVAAADKRADAARASEERAKIAGRRKPSPRRKLKSREGCQSRSPGEGLERSRLSQEIGSHRPRPGEWDS